MSRLLTLLFYLFIVRYATLDCTTHAQCEAVQTHAYCSSGQCVVQPCGGSGFCTSSRPLILAPCCTPGDPTSCTDGHRNIYPCTGRLTCFYPECHLDLCVVKPSCNEPIECLEDTPSCRCEFGKCEHVFNCTANQDCVNIVEDGLCVNNSCRTIDCPYQFPKECRIQPNKIHGCVSELCNA